MCKRSIRRPVGSLALADRSPLSGLAASYFLRQRGIDHVVLDANPRPGGAWQHRWASLGMTDVHGVADLPGSVAPERSTLAANVVVPDYFDDYERRHDLPGGAAGAGRPGRQRGGPAGGARR